VKKNPPLFSKYFHFQSVSFLSAGHLYVVLQPGLEGHVLSLRGVPERGGHRAAQLHGQAPGPPSAEALPEPRLLQPAGGGGATGRRGDGVKRGTLATWFMKKGVF